MREYLIDPMGVNGEIPEGAITVPSEDIDAAKITLVDAAFYSDSRAKNKAAAPTRMMEIFREIETESGVDWTKPEIHPEVGMSRIPLFFYRAKLRLSSWFLWNVSYPLRMWFHFRYRSTEALPTGNNAIAALLREEFAKAAITDSMMPYADLGYIPCTNEGPRSFDLIYNGKRV